MLKPNVTTKRLEEIETIQDRIRKLELLGNLYKAKTEEPDTR
jgi:hypothetical protein